MKRYYATFKTKSFSLTDTLLAIIYGTYFSCKSNLAKSKHVDTAFNRYARDGKDSSLDAFVSMLYLKDNEYIVLPSGGKNGLFSRQKPLILQKRVMKVAKIDKHVKYAIFLNYVFIKRWLSKAFPFLFPLDDEREQKDGQKKPAAPSVNWLDIFDAFVGDDVAVMEKYQAMPVATAFRLLNKRIRDAQKQNK